MESNREEAERCVRIAKAAIEVGDAARARKFLSIAQRLKSDPDVDELLAKLGDDGKDTSTSSMRNGEWRNDESEVLKDSASNSSNSTEPSPEQVEIVVRINRTIDYYEVLGLRKDSSEDDVRKAYRKLSLKVHPDKNKAPGAEEAFKAVSKAFQCLSNSELRERYDRYGPEETRHLTQQQQGMRRRRQNDYYDDMFDPDEIFQAFFFGGQGRAGGFQRQHFVRTPGVARPAGAAEAQSMNYSGVIHLVLILVVIILTSFPMSQPSHYSLERESPYLHQLSTKNRGVSYYVRSPTFDQEHPPGSKLRNQVEAQVERDYRDVLLHNCRVELNLRAWGQISETPNCKKLENFQQGRNNEGRHRLEDLCTGFVEHLNGFFKHSSFWNQETEALDWLGRSCSLKQQSLQILYEWRQLIWKSPKSVSVAEQTGGRGQIFAGDAEVDFFYGTGFS